MDTDTSNYWWLNTDPKIWQVYKYPIGHKELEETHNAEGKKRRIYSYFRLMRPGDIIIGYESSPTQKLVAIYRVTRGIHKTSKDEEVIEFEILEKLKRKIGWEDIKNNPGLKGAEPVKINNRGSIFRLTTDEYNIIRELVK